MNRAILLSTALCALAVPSVASAHQFLDYFDYGRSELSPLGYRTARDVMRYAGDGRYEIIITAYLDTAENREFSEELAMRRAQSMASELVNLGADPAMIKMRSGGIALAKLTPDYTREPLNRRLVVDMNWLR